MRSHAVWIVPICVVVNVRKTDVPLQSLAHETHRFTFLKNPNFWACFEAALVRQHRILSSRVQKNGPKMGYFEALRAIETMLS